MPTSRLEAFSDGVIAILITIMVLDLHVPPHPTIEALVPLGPVVLSYLLSFAYLGIYWNNHHHMLQFTDRTTGVIQWANLHLLFWLSLVPFATGWMGEEGFAPVPTALYAGVLLFAALAYSLVQHAIVRDQGPGSRLAAAIGPDLKGRASPVLYAAAVPAAFWDRWIAVGVFVVVAMAWMVPDRRLESRFARGEAR